MKIYKLISHYDERGYQIFRPPVILKIDCDKLMRSGRESAASNIAEQIDVEIIDYLEYIKDQSKFPKNYSETESKKPVSNAWFNCNQFGLSIENSIRDLLSDIDGWKFSQIGNSSYSLITPVNNFDGLSDVTETGADVTPKCFVTARSSVIFLNELAAHILINSSVKGLGVMEVNIAHERSF